MEQPPHAEFKRPDASQIASRSARYAPWYYVRKPRYQRPPQRHAEERGPYETRYAVIDGYPDREIIIP